MLPFKTNTSAEFLDFYSARQTFSLMFSQKKNLYTSEGEFSTFIYFSWGWKCLKESFWLVLGSHAPGKCFLPSTPALTRHNKKEWKGEIKRKKGKEIFPVAQLPRSKEVRNILFRLSYLRWCCCCYFIPCRQWKSREWNEDVRRHSTIKKALKA